MRISFRVKILLALTATVALLLAGFLAAVERAYASRVQALITGQVHQGHENFDENIAALHESLRRNAERLAISARLVGGFDAADPARELANGAAAEIELRNITADLLVVADRERRPLIRLRDGAATKIDPARRYPEAHLVEELDKGAQDLDRFLVDEGRLYQVVPHPIESGRRLGTLLLGEEIRNEFMKRIIQAKDDHAGFVIGGRIIGLPADIASALRDRIARLGPRAEKSFDLEIAGRPYHIDLKALQDADAPEPIVAVLVVSLQSLVDFRRDMRSMLVLMALAALGIAALLSVKISSDVSSPVGDLVDGTKKIAAGEYSHRLVPRSRDELGDLAVAFNRMAEDLATKEKVRAVLDKVVAKEVAEELLRGGVDLGGTLVRASLLFADIRGFTPMTLGMPPQNVIAMLNEYMTAMHKEILACRGIVDKYVGDAIIALFGAPLSYGYDAFASVEAAYRMRECLAKLNEVRAGRGDKPLTIGIGIHTGEVVAGRMGSEQQLNYTCIGEAMNLASRLCSAAKAGQILISKATLDEAGPKVEAKPLPPIMVKGFNDPVAIYEVVRVEVGETARRRKE